MSDGMCGALMLGFGETYLSAFAVFLGAGAMEISLLAALPQFFGSLFQMLSVVLSEKFQSRRKFITTLATAQVPLWAAIALLAFFNQLAISAHVLIALVIAYHISAGLYMPVWSSLIGDIVPNEIRGRYFGERNRWISFLSFTALLIGGKMLSFFQARDLSAWGFFCVFSIAALARAWSARWLSRYEDPPAIHHKENRFTLFDFLGRARHSNFARFVFFVGAMNCAVFIAAPLFTLYMLRDLQMTYFDYTLVSGTAVLSQIITFRAWGRISDRYGNKQILDFCCFGVSIVPLLWLFSSHFWWLIIVQLFAGGIWAGYNLAASNFMFDAVTPGKRSRCVAYQAFVNTSFLLCGSILGARLATSIGTPIPLHEVFNVPHSPILQVILISGIVRWLIAIFFRNSFTEVRAVKTAQPREIIYRIAHFHPFSGLLFRPITSFLKGEKESDPDDKV